MLIHMIAMGVMEVTIVEIVHMVAVLDGGMTAARTVLVVMIGVLFVGAAHDGNPRIQSQQIDLKIR